VSNARDHTKAFLGLRSHVTRAHRAIAEIRELQRAEQTWRGEHPQLAHRFAVLDLLTSCGFQYYSEHAVEDDLVLLDRAAAALTAAEETPRPTTYEHAVRTATLALAGKVAGLPRNSRDLDDLDRLARVVVAVPTQVVLGRDDPEASSDLVCWNECHGLLEAVALPYRTASRISALGFLGAADRYRIIDTMVAMRERYESQPAARRTLDDDIRVAAAEFVDWFSTTTTADGR
jgi:hypothetical protein